MNTSNTPGLISFAGEKTVASLTADQVRSALSKALTDEGVALIHLSYPAVDNRNHKSLYALVSQLSGHGFDDTALMVGNEAPYLAFNDLAKALQVYHEIQKDSVAITASLFYAGHAGLQAEEAIQAKLPHRESQGLHLDA